MFRCLTTVLAVIGIARAATISTVITTTVLDYAPTQTPVWDARGEQRRSVSETLTTTKSYGGAPPVRTVTRTIYADSPLPTITYLCDNLPRICENTARSLGMLPGINGETVWYYDPTLADGNGARRKGVCGPKDTKVCKFLWGCNGHFQNYYDWPTTCDESPPAAFLQGGIGAEKQCASSLEQGPQGRVIALLSELKDSNGMPYALPFPKSPRNAAFAVVLRIQHSGYLPAPRNYAVFDAGGARLSGIDGYRTTVSGQLQGHTASAAVYKYNTEYFNTINRQAFNCISNSNSGASSPNANIYGGQPTVAPPPCPTDASGRKRDWCVEPNGSPPPDVPITQAPAPTPPTTPPNSGGGGNPPAPAPVTTGDGGGGGVPAPIPAPHGGPPIIPALIPLLLVPGPGVPNFASWNGGRGAAAGSSCVNDGATKVVALRAPEATKGAVLCNDLSFEATMEAAENSGYFRLRRLSDRDTFIGYQTKPQDVDGCSGISAVGFTNISETTWVIDCDTQHTVPFNDGEFQVQAAVDIGLAVPLAGQNIGDVECYQSKVEVPVWTDAYWTMYPGTTVPSGAVAECSGFPERREVAAASKPTLSAIPPRHRRW